MRQAWAVAVIVGAAALGAKPARADEGGAHDKAAAAFAVGRRLLEAGNCDDAVPKLRESLAHESSIGARLSIVDCTEQRDPLSAWRLLGEAGVLALMNHDERLAVVEQRASVLQARLAMLTFRLPALAEQPGFELRVDGEIVDRFLFRYGFATSAGPHVVEADAPHGKHFSASVTTAVGAPLALDVTMRGEECKVAPSAPAPLATPPPSYDRGATRRTLGLALGGVGLAGLAGGVVFGLLTLDKKQGLEAACGGSTGACAAPERSLDAERESAKTTAALSTVSFAIGGAALLGGAALYLTAPSANGPRQGVRVSPQASRGGGGLRLEGSF